MKKIRIKNMRSLVDTGEIEIKPINMLVGNNSSGKSTFVRLFPLLKQSFLRRINGPILWSGDDNDYVDFGSYRETINRESLLEKENSIRLEFVFECNISNIFREIIRFNRADLKKYDVDKEIKFSLAITNKKNSDVISEIQIECDNLNVRIDKLKDKFYLNNKEINSYKSSNIKEYRESFITKNQTENDILNVIYNSFNFKIIYNRIIMNIVKDNSDTNDMDITTMFVREFAEILLAERVISKQLDLDACIEKYMKVLNMSPSRLKKQIENNLKTIFLNESITDEILNLSYMDILAKHSVKYIQSYFLNVNYIKPVRAHAERYYRLRNLSVEQVDSDGKNLPMFINSLTEKNLKRYNTWLKKSFGFMIKPVQTDGHVSIYIENDGTETNLSDTGYGYSQLLPIITQLWLVLNAKENNAENISVVFLIEQPELHLHPQLQAKLIDVIAKIAKEKRIQFFLETHSETMINRIGNLIYKEKLTESDVNVMIFEKENERCNTKMHISKFNEEGYLIDWPIGFFGVDEIK